MMRKFISKLVLFVVFYIFFYVLFLVLIGISNIKIKNMNFYYFKPDPLLLRIEEIKQFDSLKILFLGSSRGDYGFDTRIFNAHGLKSYNFSSRAQTPVQTAYLYNRYAKDKDIDLIVFEVNPNIFSNKGIEASCYLINNNTIDYEMIKLVLKTKHPMVYNAFVFRSLQSLFRHKLSCDENVGGYIKGTGHSSTIKTNDNYRQVFKSDSVIFNETQIAAFKKMISMFNDQNRKYLLVQAPITKKYYTSLLGNGKFDSLMSSLGEYYNFNNLISLDDSLDFSDYNHLNDKGAAKFNKALIELLNDSIYNKYK